MAVRKHSITIAGHRTSFSIEPPFLDCLRHLAERSGLSLASLIAEVDRRKPRDSNLSSALRVHVLYEALAGRLSAKPTDRT
ncbi:ribbon-helix-helix domain-containing protein [Oricola cellulosilytica]|uniref:Aryl-sulfate sulfotransferase n=1 Tax=Oricola cellulosilytica TaxID=1429082 RepID=A0A4V2MNY8_9HYPH|nr:ribbon-helix-helix domain-containing protein [Oricola cellulosilytica]TCD15207.1 aryl-sulfate sulfotransferase [Oricola cellulosilytica]